MDDNQDKAATPSYSTEGFFYVNPTMTGDTGLVSLEASEYENLLAMDVMDKEVMVELTKADTGSEYEQGKAPKHKTKAGLYTIKMDATILKPQVDLAAVDVSRMRERGFRDLDKVKVVIEPLPYMTQRTASYGELKMDF